MQTIQWYFLLLAMLSITACQDHVNPTTNTPNSQAEHGTSNPQTPERIKLRPESLAYIKVQEVSPVTSTGTISAPGRVDFRAKAVSTAATVVAGRISKLFVQIGDRVKAGEPLATLASAEALEIRSNVNNAMAELERAEDRFQRQQEMQRTGVGLEIEKMEAETQLRVARTEFERLQEDIKLIGDGKAGEVIIRAPMDSSILRTHVSVGSALERGAPLFDLGEPSALWIVADVFEKDLTAVDKGAKASIEIPSLLQRVSGHVVAESTAIQADLRRAAVFIEPEDHKPALRPGMYARVNIEASGPGHMMLPTSAILIKDGQHTLVYVEKNTGNYEARNVIVGPSHEGMTPILEGLSGGERVVVSGALLIDSEALLLL